MLDHIVLFKVVPEATRAQAEKMLKEIIALKSVIPGIISASAGINFSDRAKGYTHGLVMRFRDRAALEAYLPHPAHQGVIKEFIQPISTERLVVDYDVLEG